jgi:hypothetical protein
MVQTSSRKHHAGGGPHGTGELTGASMEAAESYDGNSGVNTATTFYSKCSLKFRMSGDLDGLIVRTGNRLEADGAPTQQGGQDSQELKLSCFYVPTIGQHKKVVTRLGGHVRLESEVFDIDSALFLTAEYGTLTAPIVRLNVMQTVKALWELQTLVDLNLRGEIFGETWWYLSIVKDPSQNSHQAWCPHYVTFELSQQDKGTIFEHRVYAIEVVEGKQLVFRNLLQPGGP